MPFSDPLADGATVQRAYHAALENGVTVADCMSVAADARRANEVPSLFMSYYNPIHNYGLQAFRADCAACRRRRPDSARSATRRSRAPQSRVRKRGHGPNLSCRPHQHGRAHHNAWHEMASGFIYCVSLTGVTGARSDLGEAAGRPRRSRSGTHRPSPRRGLRHQHPRTGSEVARMRMARSSAVP